ALWSGDYEARHRRLVEGGDGILLYDVLDDLSQRRAGELLWGRVDTGGGLFCAGSSGVEYALIAHWRQSGAIEPPARSPTAGESEQVFVVSGSCSPVTAGQIGWALDNGFEGYPLDPAELLDPATAGNAVERAIAHCSGALAAGRSVVAYSTIGAPDDRTRALFTEDPEGFSHRLGQAQGRVLTETLRRTGVRRAVVAGGDTSGHAMQEMGAYALTTLAPIAPGSPLCTAHADDPDLDGLEIALKGGQVGREAYFEHVRAGHA
ncbi:MAG TPA: nucleotide-binding domain containing protein, partial [Gammaproteobacteria bacterium]|nr:nucleotide-binding domain containing protein [Gammaproteobacteria bacterium]